MVSVVMTLYNKGAYVQEAVQSVLSNTFTDLELLVVDDASTDGGAELVAAMSDPRIRLLRSAVNTGRPAAANRGFCAATGQFIAIMDADDIAHRERFQRQVDLLTAHPEVDVVGTLVQLIGSAQGISRSPSEDRECRAGLLFGDPVLYQSSMFRRTLVTQHHARCPEGWRIPGMDYLFLISISRVARFANIQEPLLYYRIGENNIRHERDVIADRTALYTAVLKWYGLTASESTVRSHLILRGLYPTVLDRNTVVQLKSWCDTLREWNRATNEFPVDGFEARLEQRWRKAFHPIADRSLRGGLEHLRAGGGDLGHWRYLIAATLKRWRQGGAH